MKAQKTAEGLYVFPIEVIAKNGPRQFKGLIDTGSTVCASTYKIIVSLHARPTTDKLLAAPTGTIKSLGYSLKIGFDGKSMMTHVYRVPMMMEGIDFILGLPVLNQCKLTIENDCMHINWN